MLSSSSSSHDDFTNYTFDLLDDVNLFTNDDENADCFIEDKIHVADGVLVHISNLTGALRQLAYDYTPDALDEYLQMSGRESLQCIIDLYENDYLRELTLHYIQRFYEAREEIHGFSRIMIDCMHWAWEKCTVAWRDQYIRGDHTYPTIMLEVVCLV
ncbi:uncharacterized protein [Rutidosis leptorrhynchoides]|uniref:uncharacterized protein n=1 Tax=Rutidosis leptorrhynchoides TaxID=125765 RepID=UPI003A98E424